MTTKRQPVKGLFCGTPGVGKTGALAALARAGYELFIINCDNNLNILASLLADDPAALARVHYATCTDKRKAGSEHVKFSGKPSAYTRAVSLMDNWKIEADEAEDIEAEDFGRPSEWGCDRVLVIDSGTRLSEQAFDFSLFKNGKMSTDATWQDYMTPQRAMAGVWGLLNAAEFNTNVLIIMHIKTIEKEIDKKMVTVGELPAGVGTAGSEQVGGFFPVILKMERSGTGDSVKRRIFTRPSGLLETKMPALSADRMYDGPDALAEIFKLLGNGLPVVEKKPKPKAV